MYAAGRFSEWSSWSNASSSVWRARAKLLVMSRAKPAEDHVRTSEHDTRDTTAGVSTTQSQLYTVGRIALT
jgi:hypothetical protein